VRRPGARSQRRRGRNGLPATDGGAARWRARAMTRTSALVSLSCSGRAARAVRQAAAPEVLLLVPARPGPARESFLCPRLPLQPGFRPS
jgi:hypothetical protein